MNKMATVIIVLFCASLFFGVVLAIQGDRPDQVVQLEFAIGWIRQILGTLLASIAVLVMLVRAIGDEPLSRLVPLLVALFAALLLISIHWTITIPLGLTLVGYIVKETLLQFRWQTEKEST